MPARSACTARCSLSREPSIIQVPWPINGTSTPVQPNARFATTLLSPSSQKIQRRLLDVIGDVHNFEGSAELILRGQQIHCRLAEVHRVFGLLDGRTRHPGSREVEPVLRALQTRK